MVWWFLAGIGLYQVALFLPDVFLVTRIGVHKYLLSRDDDPAPNVFHARAQRAHRNYLESLPLFLGLSVLSLIVDR
ncbi:MAPEG family protein [Pseudophaeobacter sp.]|uniref:MAPEG family protein n=1 Tax=Pseudophaeobacter sp. TaxID=1971739 RepID=UPI0040594C85